MADRNIAKRRIKEFRRKYGEAALRLAYHAALPVVINAELLHLLRINFFLDCRPPLDYFAEGDLLLSPLCFEIGDGLYEIEHTIRDELLRGLLKEYGQERTREIATLLRRYTERHLPWHNRPALRRAQELTASDAIDHARVARWLWEAEQATEQQAVGQWEWFVAMRKEIENRDTVSMEGRKRAFEFDVITVNERGEEIERRRGKAESIKEYLGNGVFLEMVFIPGGTFLMGSPENEKERRSKAEGPQHEVTVAPFLMGKYPITQEQWKAVAALPQVERELEPNPSEFKGAKRPVEEVSWHDAVEFCKRLSQHTGHTYRLPSEAEWEYACRAGTTTPFHFGATITSDLANYDGTNTYASESKGVYRKETTEVGSFPPNAFGLYDMHGNVREWCQDWYDEGYYSKSPSENPQGPSSWTTYRVQRGGSWVFGPPSCRCAYRAIAYPGDNSSYYSSSCSGFRVVIALGGWTL